jgi:putative ABC transport system ATP-binding protein
VVTHDEELAARCDRRIIIRDGLLVEDSKLVAA